MRGFPGAIGSLVGQPCSTLTSRNRRSTMRCALPTSLLRKILVACLGGICLPPAIAQERTPAPVLARDLKGIGAWAQWTRRQGYSTVQIILGNIPPPDRRTVVSGVATPASAQRKAPQTQVWLLRADG